MSVNRQPLQNWKFFAALLDIKVLLRSSLTAITVVLVNNASHSQTITPPAPLIEAGELPLVIPTQALQTPRTMPTRARSSAPAPGLLNPAQANAAPAVPPVRTTPRNAAPRQGSQLPSVASPSMAGDRRIFVPPNVFVPSLRQAFRNGSPAASPAPPAEFNPNEQSAPSLPSRPEPSRDDAADDDDSPPLMEPSFPENPFNDPLAPSAPPAAKEADPANKKRHPDAKGPSAAAPDVPPPSLTTGDDEPFTPELLALRAKIGEVLAGYEQRLQNTRDNTPWEIMHAFVAFNVRTQILRDGPKGTPVNAIGWILWGQRCNGQPLLTLQNGRPHAEIGVGVQGHPGQLLAILAQSRVSLDTPLKIQGRDFTLKDLLEEEKLDCRADTELTFRLIAFSHYLDLNETWRSRDGQTWSIPRLIQEELKAPVRGAACGGTHRLFGLSYAYRQRMKRGEPLDGQYAKAKKYIEEYQNYAFSIMNPDGSFSTQWFARGENRPDVDRKIQTTGHALEWLILSQDNEELRSPRMIKTVDYVATQLQNDPRRSWKLGPLGHALHALTMYNERVFKAEKVPPEFVANKPRRPQAGPLGNNNANDNPLPPDPPALGPQLPARRPAEPADQGQADENPALYQQASPGPALTLPPDADE